MRFKRSPHGTVPTRYAPCPERNNDRATTLVPCALQKKHYRRGTLGMGYRSTLECTGVRLKCTSSALEYTRSTPRVHRSTPRVHKSTIFNVIFRTRVVYPIPMGPSQCRPQHICVPPSRHIVFVNTKLLSRYSTLHTRRLPPNTEYYTELASARIV